MKPGPTEVRWGSVVFVIWRCAKHLSRPQFKLARILRDCEWQNLWNLDSLLAGPRVAARDIQAAGFFAEIFLIMVHSTLERRADLL
jgi:hypothetical protein